MQQTPRPCTFGPAPPSLEPDMGPYERGFLASHLDVQRSPVSPLFHEVCPAWSLPKGSFSFAVLLGSAQVG